MSDNAWKDYYEKTKNKRPRPLLVKALPFVKDRIAALDLGAGALNDSIYLLSENFTQVIAVDKEPLAEEIARTLPSDKFIYKISRLEDFSFSLESANLVNAQYSLPFILPESFEKVWRKIGSSLKKDGIFTGQLFGDRDEWNTDKNMTFHSAENARKVLTDFELLEFQEEEVNKTTAAGYLKHWHLFNFIARKRASSNSLK